MRIDVHTHIFTLRAILNSEALQVILERLRRRGCPKVLVDAIHDVLQDLLDRPRYLDERHLLKLLIEKLIGSSSLGAIASRLPQGAFTVTLEGELDDLALDVLQDIITKFVDAAPAGGKVGVALNVIQALRQAMKPTITDVADDILAYMDDDDGVAVALMMDIFAPPESERDARTYRHHVQGTAEASLQRPGRILPFFGVHPDRPQHLEALQDAVLNKGFVGVKLYPSLGYDVDSGPMRKVYEFCQREKLPVLLHCGHGGFFRTEEARSLCDPHLWTSVLDDFPEMRVCFAHFGGWKALGRRHFFDHANWDPDPEEDGPDPDANNWGKKIYDFMTTRPNVYTDLAKHVDMFEDPADERMYFETLHELLADPVVGNRILYGSDAWLLRLDMPYADYWRKWKAGAGAALDAISVDGPREFLGFPASDTEALAPNLQRYVDHMRAHRANVGRPPAPWLQKRISEPFSPDRDPPEWDFTKLAVRDTYQFLGKFLTKGQKERGYRANRTAHLSELRYFDTSDPNFGARCRDMARRFVDFADQDMKYQPGHSFGSAVDLFIEVFRAGELRLCDVAMVLDSIIDYPEAIS